MKNNRSTKTNSNIFLLESIYCIAMENAGQRTQGRGDRRVEGRYYHKKSHGA